MRPRRERVAFSIPRRTLFLLASAAVFLAIGLFAFGFALGRSGSSSHSGEVGITKTDPNDVPSIAGAVSDAPDRSRGGAPGGDDLRGPGRREDGPSKRALEGSSSPTRDPRRSDQRDPGGREGALTIEPIAPASGFGLQIGAYPKLEEAEAYLRAHRDELRALKVHVIPTVIQRRGVWHRIRVGVFASRGDAEAAKQALPEAIARDAIVISYR